MGQKNNFSLVTRRLKPTEATVIPPRLNWAMLSSVKQAASGKNSKSVNILYIIRKNVSIWHSLLKGWTVTPFAIPLSAPNATESWESAMYPSFCCPPPYWSNVFSWKGCTCPYLPCPDETQPCRSLWGGRVSWIQSCGVMLAYISQMFIACVFKAAFAVAVYEAVLDTSEGMKS